MMEELDMCDNSSIQMPLSLPVCKLLVTKILVNVLVNQKYPASGSIKQTPLRETVIDRLTQA